LKYLKNKTIFLYLFSLLSVFAEAKIYDCFCFYNEFEILKIRLEELGDSVDYFVLVESIETQKGALKPLYFQENASFFEKYRNKIIHIIVNERHPEFTPWQRENYQRSCISRGLGRCKPHDIILISDVDEIPRKKLLPAIINKLHHQHTPSPVNGVGLQQSIYFFQLNRQTPTKETWGGGLWMGTVATTYRDLQQVNPQYFRDRRSQFPPVYDAGWHFTWMGGKDMIRKKMVSVVEGDDAKGSCSDEFVEEWLAKHPAVPLDESFPEYILKNEEYFKSIGYIAPYN
jgi:beta-1,4-mannosyl-glycoprotein beta-1,4-N-acetylglucosaminyltransferase